MSDNPSDAPFTPISEIGEFGLIGRLRDRLGEPDAPGLLQGIGDDAAVYRVGDGPDGKARVHVVTTDALVEGVHFDRTYLPMEALGAKALAVNVSDVVAMNAEPRYATVALGLPNNVSVEQAEALYDGFARAAETYGLAVVGGDVTASARLVLSITVVGEAAESDVVYRHGAEPGDVLCVTGDLGASAAGLRVLLQGKAEFERGEQPDLSGFARVVERHLAPRARLDVIRAWREADFRPHALIDLSDGLASEAHHIARASGVGVRLDAPLLPVHLETFRAATHVDERPEAFALFGGEDYELLFAADEATLAALPPESYAVIGEITDEPGEVWLRRPDGEPVPLEAGGFRHF